MASRLLRHTTARQNAKSGRKRSVCTLSQPWFSAASPPLARSYPDELFRFGKIHCRGSSILLFLDFEAHALAFVEAAQAGFLHRTDVNEDVLAPGIRSNEPVTLGRIEPLYNALGHRLRLSSCGSAEKTVPPD